MSEPLQVLLFRASANDGEIWHQSLTLQKFHRLQKQVHALVGDESSEKCDCLVTNDIRKKTKDIIVVWISNHDRGRAEAAGDRLTNGDIRNAMKQCVFDSIVPTNLAAHVLNPGLMHNHGRRSQNQRRNQTAKADVVLKKEIGP